MRIASCALGLPFHSPQSTSSRKQVTPGQPCGTTTSLTAALGSPVTAVRATPNAASALTITRALKGTLWVRRAGRVPASHGSKALFCAKTLALGVPVESAQTLMAAATALVGERVSKATRRVRGEQRALAHLGFATPCCVRHDSNHRRDRAGLFGCVRLRAKPRAPHRWHRLESAHDLPNGRGMGAILCLGAAPSSPSLHSVFLPQCRGD